MKRLLAYLLCGSVFACSSSENAAPAALPPNEKPHAVILADTSVHDLVGVKHSLTLAGYRVLTSHTGGETATDIMQRLPWLLQPGVDILYFDGKTVGLEDSLINADLQPLIRRLPD